MASKRKRVVLSLADKLKIIEQLDKGVTDGSSSRKTMKTATNKNLEDAVFKWFLQQRSMGNPISGPILCEKSKILAEKLGYSSFKASNGWLRNFKFRHGVRELDLAAELLEIENGQFKTTFLPPNVTSLLQPMDQSVIETMKRHYRRQLLRKLLIEGAEDEELVLANHSKINLKDCCYMVAEAWSLVTAVTLRQVSAEDVGEWMACDTSDLGFQILNDDEIVVSVREDVEVEVEEELSADVEVDAGPSASEAFAGLETALKGMERQPECDHLQLLTVKRMRDLAAGKRLKTAKQLTLTEMFKKQ
ncbi:unnamed protein product [Arctia plantaginis]|uniref:HTH CENPB-type domain-containing protein n=1 Tax=Arctia plantaginis TaxID=874455 RepID=A0A8S0YRU5_ARCPL|nr:unnamed protein product [Arctia plantaginis]